MLGPFNRLGFPCKSRTVLVRSGSAASLKQKAGFSRHSISLLALMHTSDQAAAELPLKKVHYISGVSLSTMVVVVDAKIRAGVPFGYAR